MTLNPFAALKELRELRARVATLEFAICEANSMLESGEGVNLLYYWYEDTSPSFRREIELLIPKSRWD